MRIEVRWRKALRDLVKRPGRSLLTVLALGAGVFEVALVLFAYGLLQPELRDVYGRTVPASATLSTDRVSDELVDSLRAMPGVSKAESRPVLVARARASASHEWLPAQFHVVRDFDRLELDLFTRDEGVWPPKPGDLVLERTALEVAGVKVGDSLSVRLEDGRDLRLRVAGTAHAPGMAPAWMEHMVPGFIGWDSALRGPGHTPEAGPGESPQFRLVATHALDEGDIRERTEDARALLIRNGVVVHRTQVPTPGKHPHADQMAAFRFLLLSFGLLSLALSAVLVSSMVHAFMAEQVREVGILKAVGATSRQVASIYLLQVTVLAALGLAAGLPFGIKAGRMYAEFTSGILNTDVSHSPFPWWVLGVVIGVGLLLPLLVSLGPVRRAAAITVREALADEAPPLARLRGIDAWLRRLTWLPRPLALSFRTALARRARLALAVGLLATGGAAFMAALNVTESWTRAVDADFARRRYDLMLMFPELVAMADVERVLRAVPEVENTEYWIGSSPWIVDAKGVATTSVSLAGVEPRSPLLAPRIVAGRWLTDGDTNEVVVNQAVTLRGAGYGPGDTLRLRLRGATRTFAVVGVARELAPMPTVYATRTHVLAATGRSPDSVRTVRVVLAQHGAAAERSAARKLERGFEVAGIRVSHLQRMEDAKQAILDHLVIIFSILTLAASVVVFVGALGLTSTLTLSVLQRTRELGVMGALGATPRTLATHVWLEGLCMALLSWLGAVLLTLPLSYALGAACGSIFLRAPLDFYLSPRALAIWLGLVLVLGTFSSFHPALRAARLRVRDALGHV